MAALRRRHGDSVSCRSRLETVASVRVASGWRSTLANASKLSTTNRMNYFGASVGLAPSHVTSAVGPYVETTGLSSNRRYTLNCVR